MTHTSLEHLTKRLQTAAQQVEIGGVYEHYKTAGRYIVDKVIIMEADESITVVYYPEGMPGLPWGRPLAKWLEEIDGKPRFSLVSAPEQK